LDGLEGLHVFPDRPIWSGDNKRFGPVIPARRTVRDKCSAGGLVGRLRDGADFSSGRYRRFKAFYLFGRRCGPVAQLDWGGGNEAVRFALRMPGSFRRGPITSWTTPRGDAR